MTNDYTTSTDAFQDISEGTYSSSDYPQMASFVTVASRLIDAEMGREDGFFYPTTDEVTRYYDGSGEQDQPIDEFVSINAVGMSEQGRVGSTDYTAITGSDYYFSPYNYVSKALPITALVMDTLNNSQFGAWYSYRKAVKVTGIAGYSLTPPAVVEQAVKIQACRWFMRAKQGWNDTGATVELGGMTFKGQTQLDPDVKALLYPLKLDLS